MKFGAARFTCLVVTLARAISDGFRGKFPEVIYAEIAPYMEAPGGDDDD